MNVLNHDMGNFLTVFAFKNQDDSLEPVLRKMKKTLDTNIYPNEQLESCSLGDIVCSCVLDLNYNFNVDVERDLKVCGYKGNLEIFAYLILKNFVKKGSKIILNEKYISFSLKSTRFLTNTKEIIEEVFRCRVEFSNNVIKLYWGT